ncbi:MAG: stress responsive alpha-beta barrel domain-containing protein [Rhizobiales bacterium]|nr:stress responsive alpha-beta barrel domain-containing protein [Hyphomicrobiales bacterium]MBA69879.1 stress responsive alpha-beta barrel domain-containing protein [Hyphomicrobiales bacterium]|tara:strand:- start:2842 stop:3132 length:291 start_codon:yes stop_codon:yes gene_type:complete
MIRHTVVFTLKHEAGSSKERDFLEAARQLATIATVEKFEQLRQVSPKCDYTFGFSMEFADQAAYDFYNDHPLHRDFVENRWMKEVSAFQEIDYLPL